MTYITSSFLVAIEISKVPPPNLVWVTTLDAANANWWKYYVDYSENSNG